MKPESQNEVDETQDKLVPALNVYEYFRKTLSINPRTILWYVSEDLLPPPVRQGREAFYNVPKSQIYSRVHVIHILQKDFNFRLWEIKELMGKYEGQSFHDLKQKLEGLSDQFPMVDEDQLGNPYRNSHNELVQDLFLDKLRKGTPIEKLKILDLEKEAEEIEKKANEHGSAEIPF